MMCNEILLHDCYAREHFKMVYYYKMMVKVRKYCWHKINVVTELLNMMVVNEFDWSKNTNIYRTTKRLYHNLLM